MDLMVVEERLLAAQSKLRAQLGILPSSSRVAQTSGPVAVPVSAPFDDAIAQAASHLVRRLDVVTSMLEQHTDGLRAAASLLGTADSAAAHTATVLLDAAGAASAASSPAPSSTGTSAPVGTAADRAAATGSMK